MSSAEGKRNQTDAVHATGVDKSFDFWITVPAGFAVKGDAGYCIGYVDVPRYERIMRVSIAIALIPFV